MDFNIEKHTVLKVIHGSFCYGTNIEGSDIDYRGVAIAPLDYYLGLKHFEQKIVNTEEEDETIFEIGKFLNLCSKGNPNTLEILFVGDSDIKFCDKIGEQLLENRQIFLTKKLKNTLSGYAHSQFHRIKTHRRYVLNPPSKKPERADFGLSEVSKVSQSEHGAFDVLIKQGEQFSSNIMELLSLEKKYFSAKREWDQYQNWINTRNPKRFEMEKKFGYDGKHALHLVRLMKMGKEVLEGKGFIVKRPDAEELLSIRKGAWTYEQLEEWFNKTDLELEEIYKKSNLPEKVDFNKLNNFCMDMILKYHNLSCLLTLVVHN